ncbi:MAG TPA: response regulator [Chromatiales bacterium]|nr:response regulator [Chromatiales bacterium]
MIRLLLVDDHDLVRSGIRRLIEDHSAEEGIVVVGEADSGESAVRMVGELRPDVVLMDVNMPGIGGMEATRRMLRVAPDLKVIIVTVHDQGPFPRRLLEAGALGYLSKGCGVDEIITAIRTVMRGQRYLSAEVAQRLALDMLPGGGAATGLDALSPREMQILYMLVQGHKVQAISETLHLSPKTVSTYKSRMQEKLNVRSDAELIRLAMEHGLMECAPALQPDVS